MNAKLTLSLDKDTIEHAKIFARSHHKSLSRMVENYLRQVTRSETPHEEIARYAAEMAGTGDDLDEQMEAAGQEYLSNS